MPEPILEVEGLIKNYGAFRAVDGISFQVPEGKVIGLLGPNGAGKTTTIHMLLGIALVNGGTIKYFGKDFPLHREKILTRINFASAFNELQGRISVLENLLVFAELYGLQNPRKKIEELAEYFDVTNLLKYLYRDLSQGQKTRTNLLKALLNDPDLILMDEPTASLDPDIADKTLTLIEELKKSRHLSILYTSHNMAEVTRICDEVIFLDRGKIVAHDTPLGLTKRITKAELRLTFDGERMTVDRFLKAQNQSFVFPSDFAVVVDAEEKLIPQIIFGINRAGVEITDIEIKKPTLEDVFLQIARKKMI